MAGNESTTLSARADASADDLLNDGATGLMYFEEYLPRYSTCFDSFGFGRSDISMTQMNTIYAKYDVERGMDIAALDCMAVAMGRVVTTAKEELDKQAKQRTALPSVWQGQAGDAAWQMLDAQIKRAEADYTDVSTLSSVLTKAATGLRVVVKAKAQAVKNYWHPTLPDIPDANGQGRENIDKFIVVAWNDGESAEGREAKRWLEGTFVPHVEATVANFEKLCADTETTVRQIYDDLVAALNGVDTAAYPMPVETPKVSTPNDDSKKTSGDDGKSGDGKSGDGKSGDGKSGDGKSGDGKSGDGKSGDGKSGDGKSGDGKSGDGKSGDGKSGDGKSGDGNSGDGKSGDSKATSNSLTGLASLGQAAQTLASAASTLTQSLETGLSSLSGLITDGIQDALEKAEAAAEEQKNAEPDDEKAGEETKGEKKVSEFDLAGKHFALEVGPDGQPKLVATDADGTSHEYSVKLDEDGHPQISIDEVGKDGGEKGGGEKGDGEKGGGEKEEGKQRGANGEDKREQPAAKSSEEDTGQPGASPGVPSGARRGEDGEHTPTVAPAPGTQDEQAVRQPDSGAQLAEAGPL
ncbi:hypothetical protein [Nocardia sp. NPDC005366]|uniref:hypothetical protein n=1 Tax=Nocardia sp. NPDC005366 TaxID=3156878 RepID=UPI0033B15F4F